MQILKALGRLCGCVRQNRKPEVQSKDVEHLQPQLKSMYNQVHLLLDKVEIDLLQMIYKDLASRTVNHKLNLENFQLFFKLQGSWGRFLFQQFTGKDIQNDQDQISKEHFLYGMTKIQKGSQQQKIKFLFAIFSQQDQDQQGISFRQFIKMLCNYPKEDLKLILQDQDFIKSQMKHQFIQLRPLSSSLNNVVQYSNIAESMMSQQQVIDAIYQNSKWVAQSLSKSKSDEKQQHQITQYLINDNTTQTHFIFQFQEKKYDVHLNSLHMLVKKFGTKVFEKYKLSKKTGKLSLQQFTQWIKQHPKLFNKFYQGLHSQIWKLYEIQNHKYGNYMNIAPEIQSPCIQVFTQPVNRINIVQKVEIILIQQILIIHKFNHKQVPLDIIYLYGMIVEKVFEQKYGFGIQVTHRDRVYLKTCFFFKDQQVQKKWLQVLKYYKGSTFQQSYELGQTKGRGTYSIVYEGYNKQSKESYAIKKIDTIHLSKAQLQTIAHQSAIMSMLDHPYLVRFYQSFQNKTHLYLILEYIDGVNLLEYIQKKGKKLSQFQSAIIIKQIMIGLRYIHTLGIVHRDIKLQNIMVQNPNKHYKDQGVLQDPVKIKIIDFGFADYLKELFRKDPMSLMAGSPGYIAPQILQGTGISKKVDNFAIATILFVMLSGQFPFEGFRTEDVLIKNKKVIYHMDGETWKDISEDAKDLIKKLFQKDPEKRITLSQGINHPWFQKATNDRKKKVEKRKKIDYKEKIVY